MRTRFSFQTSLATAFTLALVVALAACDASAPTPDPSATVAEAPLTAEAALAYVKEVARTEQENARGEAVVDLAHVQAFMAAGDVGGGVLEPGTVYPPRRNLSALVRTPYGVGVTTATTNLPPGAYTTWWVFFNNPEACLYPIEELGARCGDADFFRPETGVSAFWSTGGVVGENGVGLFRAHIGIGRVPSNPDQIAMPGPGLTNPMGAELHYVIKYHGPASDDPDVLWAQTNTLLGSCFENANAVDLGEELGGVSCFDPQIAIH